MMMHFKLIYLVTLMDIVWSYEFNQTHRISAGTAIVKGKLLMDPALEITDIFVGTVMDYQYCERYAVIDVYDNGFFNLNSQLQSCMQNTSCQEIQWFPDSLLRVRCLAPDSTDTYATAVYIQVKYETKADAKYYSAKILHQSVAIDSVEMRKKCSSDDETPQVSNIVTISRDNGALYYRDTQIIAANISSMNRLLRACDAPCQGFEIERGYYGHTYSSKIGDSQNLTISTAFRQMLLLFSCMIGDNSTDGNNNETIASGAGQNAITSSNIGWTVAASIFIVLFVIALAALAFVITKLRRLQADGKTNFDALEANNNNNKSSPLEKSESVRPYASHTLVPAAGSSPGKTNPKVNIPSYYSDDRRITNTSNLTISTVVNDDYTYEEAQNYEPVTPRNSDVPPSPQIRAAAPTPKPQVVYREKRGESSDSLTVTTQPDRQSVASYVSLY